MNSNTTNKKRTGPKRVRTQEPEEEKETQKSPPSSTPSSLAKAAKNALELAVVSFPTSLQPLVLHFGHQIITARCKRYAKKSIIQRMEEDTKYIPRSAKATDFKITLPAGTKEDEERVSFLEQQIKQAKDSYESSLKSVIEECIALEIEAAKKEESQLIMDLFPSIGKAQKTNETPKAQDKPAKKQLFQAKKHKQTSIAVTKQINSESNQLLWQEKTAKEATAKKLIAQFGFVVDPTLSKRHNASITLAKMPTWYYFSRPSNMAFHDFTKRHKPQKNLRSLLELGLKFIPTPSLTNCWSRLKKLSYDRQFRSVHLRFHFAGKPPSEGTTTYDPKIFVHSTWKPPHWTIPPVALEERLSRFASALNELFKTRKGKTILLPHQHRALRTLQQQQQTFLVVPYDKNLGPPIIECHDYLKIAMRDHLSDTTTYKSLTTSEIDRYSSDITKNILGWLKTDHKILTKLESAFLRKKSNNLINHHTLDSTSP